MNVVHFCEVWTEKQCVFFTCTCLKLKVDSDFKNQLGVGDGGFYPPSPTLKDFRDKNLPSPTRTHFLTVTIHLNFQITLVNVRNTLAGFSCGFMCLIAHSKVVASHAEVARSIPGETAPVYTMHEALRGYCPWGYGVRPVNWIYFPWRHCPKLDVIDCN